MKLLLRTSIATLILVLSGTSFNAYAQRCAGDLVYLLRNAKGEIIDEEKVDLKYGRQGSVTNDPLETITRNGDHFSGPIHLVGYLIDESAKRSEPANWTRVLRVQTGCGQSFIEAALELENQVMVIRFHNIPAETNFIIDSIPFQAGTFAIDFKRDASLKDQKLNREGVKTKGGKLFLHGSAQTGFLVAAENWVKVP